MFIIDLTMINRRQFLKLAGGGIVAGAILGYILRQRIDDLDNQDIVRPRLVGTTFSQLQCKYLGLDFKETFLAVKALGFDTVRLCTYWNEIESEHGKYDFSTIDWILDQAQDTSWQVALTVGMKAPRWPEFHFPQWIIDKYDINRTDLPLDRLPGLAEDALVFTQKVVERARNLPIISYWQVENEPLNHAPVAANRYLSTDYLQREIELVRELIGPDQKILVNFGVDPPFAIQPAEVMLKPLLSTVDALGFDVYTKVPTGFELVDYVEATPPFWKNVNRWKYFVKNNQKEAWIAESQAEPWEHDKLVAIDSQSYPSSNPNRATKLASRLTTLGFDPVLLWGCEYWYWHRQNGNNEWWETIVHYINLPK